MVEWLKHRAYDQHGLGLKPMHTILLCPWERHFTTFSPAWWSWQAVLNYCHIFIKLQADSNIYNLQIYSLDLQIFTDYNYNLQQYLQTTIYKGKGDVPNCNAYRGVKLLQHGIKIVERGLKKRIRALVVMVNMQIGFMPGRGMADPLFIVRRIQEEYREKREGL